MQLFLFLFLLQHIKRPALQNKQVVVLRMAFWARKVLGTFEKRAPGRLEDSGRQNDEKLWRKTVHSQSYSSFFRHSAVLSVPVILLIKLPIDGGRVVLSPLHQPSSLKVQSTCD